MIAPQIKITVLVSTVLLLSACGGKSGGNNSSEPVPVVPPVHKKLQLKSSGVSKILIGRTVDLRKFVVNGDAARYEVIEGETLVDWIDLNSVKLKFREAGPVTVLVSDTVDKTAVALRFQTVFDGAELTPDPEGPDLTLPGGPGFP